MRSLLIVRHAKSSWDDADMKDFDRPLNDRGRRDAPAMAKRLIKDGVSIDRFISSPAKRARQTAEFFAEAYGLKHREIHFIPDLYLATLEVFRTVVTALEDKDESVALFSHNPGITAFANILSTVRLDNMPTCAIFAVKAEADHWRDFLSSSPQFWFFDYPKALGHD